MMRAIAALALTLATACATADDMPTLDLRPIGPLPAPAPVVAVMLTGDGGWREIDSRVTDVLRRNSIPVVGFRTNSYLGKVRTPAETAHTMVQAIRDAMARWKRSEVVLVGFSRGADVLPFVVRRLPADVAAKVRVVALLGPANTTQLHKRLFGLPSNAPTLAIRPEIDAMPSIPLLCFYGANEKDTICPSLPPGRATVIRMPGGHHFAGKYEVMGQAIVDALK